MKVSEYIAAEIHKLGIRHVFGYQGGNITHIVDAVATHAGLRFVQTSHEQGAAFAANGYAQARSGPGVAIASSGPGALNLVTGVANAYFDSIPVLFISGDLSRRDTKNELPLRQDGFQSTDIVSIIQPLTKYAAMVSSPLDIGYCLSRAIHEATNGRQGPAYLTIPHWIQAAEVEPSALRAYLPADPADPAGDTVPEAVRAEVSAELSSARRPIILIGGGCTDPATKEMLHKFLDRNHVPMVASLCGLSVVPHDHPCYVGFIGDYGHRHANLALAACDCLIVMGSRMDERQTGILKACRTTKKIIHVDIDPSELRPRSESYLAVNESAASFMTHHSGICFDGPAVAEWKLSLLQLERHYPVLPAGSEFTVSHFLRHISDVIAPDAQVFADVGLHQMCCAQALVLTKQRRMFVSGGLGSMGYALPACIGGHLASPARQSICISGDGGLLMSLNELQTVARERLDVKIIVINNHCLGMILEYQRKNFDGRSFGSVDGYQPCDMKKMAAAFGMLYYRVANAADLAELRGVLGGEGPVLIEAVFAQDMAPFPNGIDYSTEECD